MPEDEYDLAGFAVGVVDKKDIITGADLKAQDVLIGIASTGVYLQWILIGQKSFWNDKDSETDHDELGETLERHW